MSSSMANALRYYASDATTETANFVVMVDKFFDCLNVRSKDEHFHQRKPSKAPYTDAEDARFVVSKWIHIINT